MSDAEKAPAAVAVANGRVIALGADRQAAARSAPPEAEVLDFPGACVLPGLWDTHVHVERVGQLRGGQPAVASEHPTQGSANLRRADSCPPCVKGLLVAQLSDLRKVVAIGPPPCRPLAR